MFQQLPTFQKLIRCLQKVPYLASKNVYRVATYFLKSDAQTVEHLCNVILEAKTKIKECRICCNWAEQGDVCGICSAKNRDHNIICVVETWHDLWAIERMGEHSGAYHVLGGVLCPMEGVGPDDLSIGQLLGRLNNEIKEIIFATNPTPEGEATASYIVSKVDPSFPIVFSKLA
ncbi:MAG: toprim domain-containing protein, partial [bacterium]